MSIPLRKIRGRVQERLRDTDPRRATFDPVEIDQAICGAYIVCQARLPAPSLYVASGLTISAGADTFTLSQTAATGWTGGDGQREYSGDVRIRLRSTGEFLDHLSVEQIDALRNGNPNIQTGVPRAFCLWEDSAQAMQVRCYPGAKVAEACDLFVTLQPGDLRDYVGSGGTDDMDDVSVQFSRQGAMALELYAASELLKRMTDDDLKLRRLNPAVADTWERDARMLLVKVEAQRANAEGSGRVERWVS